MRFILLLLLFCCRANAVDQGIDWLGTVPADCTQIKASIDNRTWVTVGQRIPGAISSVVSLSSPPGGAAGWYIRLEKVSGAPCSGSAFVSISGGECSGAVGTVSKPVASRLGGRRSRR